MHQPQVTGMIDALVLVDAHPLAVRQQPQVLSATYAGYCGRVMPRTDSAVVQSVAIACWAAVSVTLSWQIAVCRWVSTASLGLFGPAPGLWPGEGGSTQRLRGSLGSPPSCRLIRCYPALLGDAADVAGDAVDLGS
jgi:hypothetical protein